MKIYSINSRIFGLALGLSWLLGGCLPEQETQLVGRVERTTYELAAPVTETLVDLPVEISEAVDDGELVARLDDDVASAELEAAEAALQAAEAKLTAAEREFKRFAGQRKAASVTQLDEARRVRDESLAQAAERRARVRQAQKRLDDLSIRAPADGIMDQLPFDVGERVPAGVVLAVIMSADAPWVRVWLPARYVARVKPGTRARVEVDGYTETLQGRVQDIAYEPEYTPHYALTERESAHLVYRSRVMLLDAPKDMRPGLAARVHLEGVQ